MYNGTFCSPIIMGVPTHESVAPLGSCLVASCGKQLVMPWITGCLVPAYDAHKLSNSIIEASGSAFFFYHPVIIQNHLLSQVFKVPPG